MFSCLFTQYKAAKGQIFMTAIQKDKSNPPNRNNYFNDDIFMLFFSVKMMNGLSQVFQKDF